MFGRTFNNKSILVTGHTGFKGSWLALWLSQLDARVTGFALPPSTRPSHFEILGLERLVRHIEGDVRDPDALQATFAVAKPEIVFHLAAQPLVRDSYWDPKHTFDVNVGGTVNVLEAIRQCTSVRAAVIVTSDKCYQNNEWVWGYRETDPIGGNDPYSASKGAAEIICAAYRESFFGRNGRGPHMGIATARAGNVIGGGDWSKDRIIPDCIAAVTTHSPIILRKPNATRPWQHVLDPLYGYLKLAQELLGDPDAFSGPWNFGPQISEQVSVRQLCQRFVDLWGDGIIEQEHDVSDAPHEANLLHLAIDKSVSKLGWRPVLDCASALQWTTDWYKSWYERPNQTNLSLDQIAEFTEKALNQRGSSW